MITSDSKFLPAIETFTLHMIWNVAWSDIMPLAPCSHPCIKPLERISQGSHSHCWGNTQRTMTKVQCSVCLTWFTKNGYLYRHQNNTPQCLVLTQQVQEVELEQGNQHMMEGGEGNSETCSMAYQRMLTESSEDNEHINHSASKRARPNSEEEFCNTTSL